MPDVRRHGSVPLYVPPAERSEEWELAELMAVPIVMGVCWCEAHCRCDHDCDCEGFS